MLLSLEAADKLIGFSFGSALKHKSLIETLFSVPTAFMKTENRHADRPGERRGCKLFLSLKG